MICFFWLVVFSLFAVQVDLDDALAGDGRHVEVTFKKGPLSKTPGELVGTVHLTFTVCD